MTAPSTDAWKAWDEATANSSGVFAALVEEVASLRRRVQDLEGLTGDEWGGENDRADERHRREDDWGRDA